MQREGEGATVRQARLIAVVGIFLIGCSALLLAVGCSGTRSEAPKEQGHTEATNKEQGHSGAASEEEARCEGTRTFQKGPVVRGHRNVVTTNDLPDCPKGGLLLGTDERDKLDGREHGDEIRGLGGSDQIFAGVGDDVIYGGPGDDSLLYGDKGNDVTYGGDGDEGELLDGKGADVIYGGDGNDSIAAFSDGQPVKLYCGKGKDEYHAAEKIDHVSSSCEKKFKFKVMF